MARSRDLPKLSAPAGPGLGAAILGYAALTTLLTWPYAVSIADRVPAGNNDLFQNLWNFWWWRHQLTEVGGSPYSTHLLFYPRGASLAFHTHSEANILWTWPILLGAGPVVALNVATLASFVIAGVGGYILSRELWGDRRAAFIAGAIFAFFPQHVEQSFEHLNLASYGFMGIATAFLWRALRTGSAGAWVSFSFSLLVNSLFAWHNTVLLVPVLVLVVLRALWIGERPRIRTATETVVAFAVTLLIHIPPAWPMIKAALHGEGDWTKPPVEKPVDLFFLIVPAPFHSIWGHLLHDTYERLRWYQSAGFVAYIGLSSVALVLAAWIFIRRSAFPRGIIFWSLVGGTCLVIALGDELRVAGRETGVMLPFRLVREIPLLDTSRLAHRYLVPAMLGVSAVAGAGAATLLARSRRRKRLAVTLVSLVAIDFLAAPYPLRDVPRPAWTKEIARAPEGAVFSIPGGYRARAAEDMYLQTLHGRPIIGGYVSVTPPWVDDLLEKYPFLRVIQEGRPKVAIDPAVGLPPILDDLPIGVVVLHRDRIREELERERVQHAGSPEERLYNPEKGMPRAVFDATRKVLRETWGEPYFANDEVELYARRQ